jgi:hypothetical protein
MKSKDSKSTQRAVTRSIKLFWNFLIQKNEPGEFETYTKQKLDEMLILFYASIRKKDGEMMKKSSSCTSINSQVRNEYNYSAGLNVLNTYRNNMATFPQQLHCKFSFLFKMRKNTLA